MHRRSLLASILAVLLPLVPLAAQKVVGGPAPDRKAGNVVVYSAQLETLAAAAVGYSAPRWQASYDEMLAQLRGPYTRLGKGWWTTFDTAGPLTLGGTKLAAGSYYLGLGIDGDGAFRLLFFDSKRAMQSGLLPHTTALYRGEIAADFTTTLPFPRDARKDVVAVMEITITADPKDPTTRAFTIRWGRHEASAPVTLTLAKVEPAPAQRK